MNVHQRRHAIRKTAMMMAGYKKTHLTCIVLGNARMADNAMDGYQVFANDLKRLHKPRTKR